MPRTARNGRACGRSATRRTSDTLPLLPWQHARRASGAGRYVAGSHGLCRGRILLLQDVVEGAADVFIQRGPCPGSVTLLESVDQFIVEFHRQLLAGAL